MGDLFEHDGPEGTSGPTLEPPHDTHDYDLTFRTGSPKRWLRMRKGRMRNVIPRIRRGRQSGAVRIIARGEEDIVYKHLGEGLGDPCLPGGNDYWMRE